jgi:hypothetical protein
MNKIDGTKMMTTPLQVTQDIATTNSSQIVYSANSFIHQAYIMSKSLVITFVHCSVV